ncbi:hypothetical protein ACQPYK_31350 [Streptosporangium sp. CA-135522]|uniref:hypothetical protein n=1 Tax=Streptosporangium sp. CA-135522 TaxID=3240072 RepID=UPI003D907BB8
MSERDTGAAHRQVEYAGAVYGSLLAASVVAGSTAEGGPPSASELVVLLICTGVVFWITHVYAQLVSRGHPARFAWASARGVARQEWPLAQASFFPAIAAALTSAAGASDTVAAWAALCAAVASQVAWAVTAAVKTRSTTGVVIVSAITNLVLGLAIVALKTLVSAH